jgi:hypothetical protein
MVPNVSQPAKTTYFTGTRTRALSARENYRYSYVYSFLMADGAFLVAHRQFRLGHQRRPRRWRPNNFNFTVTCTAIALRMVPDVSYSRIRGAFAL